MYRLRLFAIRMPARSSGFTNVSNAAWWRWTRSLRKIGYNRVERPIALVEKGVKTLLFDCKMCGQCVLSSTGYVLPDELPQTTAQRPLRRCTPRRVLRGEARDEMRLGSGLGRGQPDAARGRQDKRGSAACGTHIERAHPPGCGSAARSPPRNARPATPPAQTLCAEPSRRRAKMNPPRHPLAAEPPNAVNRELKK